MWLRRKALQPLVTHVTGGPDWLPGCGSDVFQAEFGDMTALGGAGHEAEFDPPRFDDVFDGLLVFADGLGDTANAGRANNIAEIVQDFAV